MLTIKTKKREENLHDKNIEAIVATYISKKHLIDALNKEINSLKEDIIKEANENRGGEKSIQFLLNNTGVKITFTDEIKIKNPIKLKESLSNNFLNFVKVEYKAKSGLRQLLGTGNAITNFVEIVDKKPTVALV